MDRRTLHRPGNKYQGHTVVFENGAHLIIGAVSKKQAVWKAYNEFHIKSEFKTADVFIGWNCGNCTIKFHCPRYELKLPSRANGKICSFFERGNMIKEPDQNRDLLRTMTLEPKN